jgi:hypothetical protein
VIATHMPNSARLAALLIVIAALTMIAAPAIAAGVEISVGAPEQVTVGQDVVVKAVLTQDSDPVEGAEVALTYQASIAGESGRVELASAITDSTGTAVMIYQQRADDNREMQIVYLGPGTDPVTPFTFTIDVAGDGTQLYVTESGLRIPFLNGTVVILVISGVWVLIALSAIYLVRVGREGRRIDRAPGETGSIWISFVLATVTVITAAGMVIVFVRAPVSNTHITDPDGYDRTIVNYLDVSYPYDGFGLNNTSAAQTGDPIADGGTLYFQFACGACHGLAGQGAVVGPALIGEIGSFGSFSEELREGPKGMPGYDEATISDEDLEKIYRFLDEGG